VRPMRGRLSGGVRGLDAFWWWSTIECCPPLRWLVACRVHRRLARMYQTACPRNIRLCRPSDRIILATVEYIYIHMGMRQQEREHAFTRVQRRYTTRDGPHNIRLCRPPDRIRPARRRKVRRRRKRGENGGACQWGGAGEREAMRRRVGREYEMRAGERQLRLYMTSAAGLV